MVEASNIGRTKKLAADLRDMRADGGGASSLTWYTGREVRMCASYHPLHALLAVRCDDLLLYHIPGQSLTGHAGGPCVSLMYSSLQVSELGDAGPRIPGIQPLRRQIAP